MNNINLNNIDTRLDFFENMIFCSYGLYCWRYDSKMNLLSSNCPQETQLYVIFSLSECITYINSVKQEFNYPVFITDHIGMVWIVAFEKDIDELKQIVVIGPSFTNNISSENLSKDLKTLNLSIRLCNNLLEYLPKLPMISIINYYQYGIMLHYCLNNEKITSKDFHYQDSYETNESKNIFAKSTFDAMQIQNIEHVLLQLVKEGNINYKPIVSNVASFLNNPYARRGKLLREAKNTSIMFTTLCSRAAIQGGVAPSQAYELTKHFIQSSERCTNLTEVSTVNMTMLDDFIHRVHKLKNTTILSSSIQKCLDYINLHIEEDLSLSDIAKHIGYSQYYLTKKFKKETGKTINQYINKAKIDHAKILLKTTDKSIQNISELLDFGSSSYFTVVFKEHVGMTPIDYKNYYESI